MAPFYGQGSTAQRLEPTREGSLLPTTKFPEIPTSRLEPPRGGSLLSTTRFPEIPGTHIIDLGRMKG